MSIDYTLGDNWRREQVARSKPYEPPSVAIDDFTEENCVCVRVNREWVPFLIGVLDVLTNPSLWIHEDYDYAPQEIIKLMLALAGTENDMTCLPPIEDILFQDGVLCIVRDGICTPIAGTESIVTGVQAVGTGWEVEQGGVFDEITGDCGNCEEYPDMPAYDNSGSLRSCSIATNLIEWLFEKYNDAIDKLETVENTVVAVDLVSLLFPAAYLLWDAVNDAVDEIYEAGISAARAYDSVEKREEKTQVLYCLLIENGNVMTEGVWGDFKADFGLDEGVFRLWLESFKYGGVDDQAHKASYGLTSGCETFPCQVCINTVIDFTASAACGDPRLGVGGQCDGIDYGSWESGSGWGSITCGTGVPTAARYNRLQLIIDLGGVYTVTRVQYTWSGANVDQEQVYTLTPGQALNGTSRYSGNHAAGTKDSGTFSAAGVDRVFIILEDVGTVGSPPNETTRYLSSVEITVTV